MATSNPKSVNSRSTGVAPLAKSPTGIAGLDEITFGGLPQGRPTLVCGGPGCGKTLLGMEFLVRGALQFQEPGVCISFEETAEELSRNVASLGFNVPALIKARKLVIDHVVLEPNSNIEETGDWDLEGLFVRLTHAVESVGARRVLLDSVEALFASLANQAILRGELRRLFKWLKERNLTAVITAERGEGLLTRHGLEEYISDCVIFLDNRVTDTIFTRRLRIVKYRGSVHGANEFPFLIDNTGFSVLPVTSLELSHIASRERTSSGISALDEMLGGGGYYRGSSVLVSGSAGTGKTSIGAHFVDAACGRGEKCIYFAFEESESQVFRNMKSIGIDLARWVERGLLRFAATRATSLGLEMHLVRMHSLLTQVKPKVVVVDSIAGLIGAGTVSETRTMLLRLIDFLKQRQVTTLLTNVSGGDQPEQTELAFSSLVDVWLLLREIESGGERNRGIYIIKARGVAHSNQIREFLLTNHGVQLRNVYLGASGVLTGSARLAEEAREAMEALRMRQDADRQRLVRERKRKALEAQIAALQLDLETGDLELQQNEFQGQARFDQRSKGQAEMLQSRSINVASEGNGGRPQHKGGRK